MSVMNIVAATGQNILSQLQSSKSKSTDTDKIKQEITKSGQTYTAQQIADKYGISEAQAEKILKEIEEAKQQAKEETKSKDKDSDAVKTSISPQASAAQKTDATGTTEATSTTPVADTNPSTPAVSPSVAEAVFTASDASTVSYIV